MVGKLTGHLLVFPQDMDDFNIITDEDKTDLSYGACVLGTTLTGLAVGRFAGVQGLLAGGGVGLAIGLLTCKTLSGPIKKKLFSQTGRLSDHELAQALQAVRQQTSVTRKSDAMLLLSLARKAGPGPFPKNASPAPAPLQVLQVARQALAANSQTA